MTDPTLVQFLLHRIAEDEAAARQMIENKGWVSDCNESHNARIVVGDWELDGRRFLADCEAKRRIVEGLDYILHYEEPDGEAALNAGHFLRLLALPFADHPGYREEWKA